jgi:succinyl-CoA synthetase beta subunit
MDLLEYQAKTLFAEVGIPVLPSQPIQSTQEIRGLKIPYPVVLKSQVRAGGRGRAGGIRFAENTIDAVAAAQAIFTLPIVGEYPELLLAEAKYDADRELYVAIAIDCNARRPILLGSTEGGMDADLQPERVCQVIVDEAFSPFHARRLVLAMGLRGRLMQSVSNIVEKMYALFVQQDLDLIEINPLGVSADGELMALDGKVTVNDYALGRHPKLWRWLDAQHGGAADRPSQPNGRSLAVVVAPRVGGTTAAQRRSPTDPRLLPSAALASSNVGYATQGLGPESTITDLGKTEAISCLLPKPALQYVPLTGEIAIVCNGMGLTLATLDAVCQAGGRPAGFVNVGWETCGNGAFDLNQRLDRALDLVIQPAPPKCILVNLLGSALPVPEIAQMLEQFLRRHGYLTKPVRTTRGGTGLREATPTAINQPRSRMRRRLATDLPATETDEEIDLPNPETTADLAESAVQVSGVPQVILRIAQADPWRSPPPDANGTQPSPNGAKMSPPHDADWLGEEPSGTIAWQPFAALDVMVVSTLAEAVTQAIAQTEGTDSAE